MNKKQREQIRIAFKQPPGKPRAIEQTAAPQALPRKVNLPFRRLKLFDFIGFNGRSFVDSISGRVYETIDLALQSAHHNIQALGGDYSTPLKEIRRLYREATQNDR